jgi:hypothetical protein
MNKVISLGFILTTMACSGSSTPESSGDCASIQDTMQRDDCYRQQIVALPPAEIDQIIQLGNKMVDPMIRGAAVAEWIKDHNNEINQQKGQELCALLDGRDRSYCMRRLSSPHLRR